MKLLRKNTVDAYFAYRQKGEPVIINDLRTGRYTTETTPKLKIRVSLSSSNGQIARDLFGDLGNYHHVMMAEVHLVDGALIWINNSIEESPDYEVVGSNESLNVYAYAIRKLNVN